MTNKVKEHIACHYLLTKIQQCALILLELNIFRKKNYKKSKINQSHTTYLEYNLMILFYVWILLYHFHRIYNSRKILLDYTNLLSPDDYPKNVKIIYKYFKDKFGYRKEKT